MIDTDKYEGHQVSDFKTSVAGPRHSWVTLQHKHGVDSMFVHHATAALVTDAPLLLAEVKRLREEVNNLNEIIDTERKKVYDIAQKLLEVIE
jgi:hypothetical protein